MLNIIRSKVFILFLLGFYFLPNQGFGQFPGPVGSVGTTAIPSDSNIFVDWALESYIKYGYAQIDSPGAGFANFGDGFNCLGKADESVVSLGDGGIAILTFSNPIRNGKGFDFAIFENAFNDKFLELAFVEVSSDGVQFFRFPATSNTQYKTQIGGFESSQNASEINNLAGKYRGGYGTPFDLQELDSCKSLGLKLDSITHVKIIDVVGNISPKYARYDKYNQPINDPFPTPFPSSGFDLDAVGVIHQSINGIENESDPNFIVQVYPNPFMEQIKIGILAQDMGEVAVFNQQGKLMYCSYKNETNISTINWNSGIYFIKICNKKGDLFSKKLMKTNQ